MSIPKEILTKRKKRKEKNICIVIELFIFFDIIDKHNSYLLHIYVS